MTHRFEAQIWIRTTPALHTCSHGQWLCTCGSQGEPNVAKAWAASEEQAVDFTINKLRHLHAAHARRATR